MLIDVVICGDRNVIKKEAEKILKYKDLKIHIQRMWNVKLNVMPVIIGANGIISISLRQYRSKHTRKARNQGTTKKNSRNGHCTHTAEKC
jgi:hypothetical protein